MAGVLEKVIYIAICAVILILDIITKIWATDVLKSLVTIPLWQNVFHLTYVENTGAAFGSFQGNRVFLVAVTLVAIGAGSVFLFKNRKKSLLSVSMAFILGGALGNLLDRVFRGFVVDMLDFRLINFPVFNVADIFVCLGAALIVIYIIFFEDKKD